MKQFLKIFLLVLLSLILILVYVTPSGYFLTREDHFIWGGMLYFFVMLFTSGKPPLTKSRKVYLIIIYIPLLFYTCVGIYAFFTGSPDPMPVWVFSNILFFLGYYLAPKNDILRRGVMALVAFGLMFLLGKVILMPNWINYCVTKRTWIKTGKEFPKIGLRDIYGNTVNTDEWKGKIIILDLWASFCAPCIRNFTSYEKVYQKFKNDSNIVITSVNLPVNGEKFQDLVAFTQTIKQRFPHTFPHLYTDSTAWNTIGIKGVPEYLIIDKTGEIKYAGPLNIGTGEFYNNFYSLVSKYSQDDTR